MINRHNFTRESLDAFSRYQVVKTVYRVKEGEMYLVYRPFVETWTLERKREKAAEILAGDHIVYGAFENGDIVGILLLLPVLEHDRMILDSFHVSTHKRRQGIGRALFAAAKEEAIRCGAKAMYVSACSARETIDFYTAMGFTLSPHPLRRCVEAEPYDIQMECTL